MHILQIFDDKQLLEISHAYMMSFFVSSSSSCFFLVYSSTALGFYQGV